MSLHWLRVPERIQYELAVLAYEILHGDAPRYLGPLTRVDDLPGRRTLRPVLRMPTASWYHRQTVNSRQPSLCGCGSTHLEYVASLHRCGKLAVHLPSTVKTFFYSSSHIMTSSTDVVVLAVVAPLRPL